MLLAVLFLAMSATVFTSCDDGEGGGDPEPEPENSILEIVAASENHTQLEAFVTANSELVSVLGGNDLTLFAPNDAAFERLRVILGVESLEQVNPDVIAGVLAFHVHTQGVIRRADIEPGLQIGTVQGESMTITAEGNIENGGTDREVEFVGDEILATNGVVHVVETILIPPTVFATIGENLGQVSQTILLGSNFSTLASAIYKADTYAAATEGVTPLTEILADEERTLTVFAPVNDVFAGGGITLDSYSAQEWYGLIANHVLFTTELQADLTPESVFTPTAAGGTITVVPSGGLDSNGVTGAEASVVVADILAAQTLAETNGVVHAINGILSPASSGRYAIDEKFRK